MPKSFRKETFAEFIDELAFCKAQNDTWLFLDNASFHLATVVKERIKENGFDVIYNLPRMPALSGIELYWKVVKGVFRRKLLRVLLDGARLNMYKLVEDSLLGVNEGTIKRCAQEGLRRLTDADWVYARKT